MTRPLAETMPVVTVPSSPKELPMAMTGWPTSNFSESPRAKTGNPWASIFSNARSVFSSRPTTLAEDSRPSWSLILISVASSTR